MPSKPRRQRPALSHVDESGTVRMVDGQPVYDWTKIDQLYDGLVTKNIRPFVELGFTPEAVVVPLQ